VADGPSIPRQTSRSIVVDTGGWLSSKKFTVPADRLRA
jgi:hypothetical protein